MGKIRDASLLYAIEGWPVVALHGVKDGQCLCGLEAGKGHKPGKHPRTDLSPHAALSATTDLEVLAEWPDDINIGISLGKRAGGLMALDIDVSEVAQALLHPNLGLSDQTGVAVTGKGAHIYFRSTGPTKTFLLKLADGSPLGEVRGDNTYVVAPPSLHETGRNYRWLGLMRGMGLPQLAVTSNPIEYVSDLLRAVDIEFTISQQQDATPLPDNTTIEQHDLPPELSGLRNIRLMLRGQLDLRNEPDRSGRLFYVGREVAEAATSAGIALSHVHLAGIVKKVDDVAIHCYVERGDADYQYWQIATRAMPVIAQEAAQGSDTEQETPDAPDDTAADTDDGDDDSDTVDFTTDATPTGVVDYIWDAGDGELYLRTGKNKSTVNEVANFLPEILVEMEVDDGEQITRAWQCRFTHADGSVFEIVLGQEDRESRARLEKSLAQLPAKYRIKPGMHDHVRAAMQELSDDFPTNREFAATGWLEHGKERLYLLPYAAGAIGANGIDPSIRLNPDHLASNEAITNTALKNYGVGVRPPMTDGEMETAAIAFGILLDAAPARVTLPVICQILAGPLCPAGAHSSPSVVHLIGETGTLKTGYSKAALSMFGTFRYEEGDPPPTTWSATATALGALLHATRDLTLLIDDFKTGVVSSRSEVLRLIQTYADGTTRLRGTQQGGIRQGTLPRGLILSNGEDIWERQASAEARTIQVPLKRGDISKDVLERAELAIASGAMQRFGGAYLQWLARHPEIFENARVITLRRAWRKRLEREADADVHPRLVSSVATLAAVATVVLDFITDEFPALRERVVTWIQEGSAALIGGVVVQGREVAALAPFRQLASTLVENMAARRVKLWPRYGIDSSRFSIPDIGPPAETVGYWYDDDEGQRWVMLTDKISFRWLQRQVRAAGETVGFSWTAVRMEALDRWGGRRFDRRRITTGNSGQRSQISGVEVLLSVLEDVSNEDSHE